MIEARELRLGNLVDKGKIEVINSKGAFVGFKQQSKYGELDVAEYTLYEFLNPIAITEKWLLKLGFTKSDENNSWFSIWWDKDAFMIYLNPSDIAGILGYGRRHQNIKWVHTLQNAFNALTGEELEVKP